MSATKLSAVCLLLFGCLSPADHSSFAKETGSWSMFRGPGGKGIASHANLPEKWSTTENVAWSTEVPGLGWSSPVIHGNRIYLTSALANTDVKEPTKGIFGNGTVNRLLREGKSPAEAGAYVTQRDIEKPAESGEVRRTLYALDANSGDLLWSRETYRGVPRQGRHRKNTYASETPVIDGTRIYVLFGNEILAAYSLSGDPLWQRQLPDREIYRDFGTGSSPAVDDRHVYVLADGEGECVLFAFDKSSGEPSWQQPRAGGEGRSGWATPFIWKTAERTEIVTTGSGRVISYGQDGRELWRTSSWSRITAPMPFVADELLILSSGSTSEPIRPLLAVRPGAEGTLEVGGDKFANTDPSASVAWYDPKGGSYIPTPVAHDGRLYVLYDKGFLSTYELMTGRRLSKQRIGRGGVTFSSSPWIQTHPKARLFLLDEEGTTWVYSTGDKPELQHRNSLDDLTLASPAIDGDNLYIRTRSHLFKIASPAED